MSDHHAIAGVTATLKALLEDRMTLSAAALPPGERVTVTTSHPDIKSATPPPGPRLNVFLFEIAQNPHLRNDDRTGTPGTGGGLPSLALDLHYLITCFPVVPEDDLTGHTVLGDALQVLNDHPVIAPAMLRQRGVTAGEPLVHDALLYETDHLRITIRPRSLEDSMRLWAALKEPIRLSVAISVSVVRLDSRRPGRITEPVRAVSLQAAPAAIPEITAVEPPRVAVGQYLTIQGFHLGARDSTVLLGPVTLTPLRSAPDGLTVAVPDHPDLQPGTLPLRVLLPGPGGGAGALVSNTASVTLVPLITKVAAQDGRLLIDGQRLYVTGRPCQVQVGDACFEPDPATASPTHLEVALGALAPSQYAVRVRLDSRDSLPWPPLSVQWPGN